MQHLIQWVTWTETCDDWLCLLFCDRFGIALCKFLMPLFPEPWQLAAFRHGASADGLQAYRSTGLQVSAHAYDLWQKETAPQPVYDTVQDSSAQSQRSRVSSAASSDTTSVASSARHAGCMVLIVLALRFIADEPQHLVYRISARQPSQTPTSQAPSLFAMSRTAPHPNPDQPTASLGSLSLNGAERSAHECSVAHGRVGGGWKVNRAG